MFYKETDFKETTIGMIPRDWKFMKLGDVSNVDTGGNAPQGDKYFKNGKYPFIRVQHFDGDKIYVDKWDLINDEAVNEYRLKIFPKDSIVFPKSGASINLEKRAMLPFDSYVVNHLCVLVPNSQVVDSKFLFYILKRTRFSKNSAGTTLPYLNLEYISKVPIPIPPLEEQRAIAGVLGFVDSAVELVDRVIAKTERLKKGLMQTLLTRGIGHKEYKQTPIGKIPKTWEIDTLNHFIDKGLITYHMDGNHGELYPREEEFVEEGVPFLSANMITDGEIDFSKAKYVTEERAKQFRKGIAKDGDVLFAHNATVGPVAILKTSLPYVVLGTTLTAYRCNLTYLNNYYLKYFIESPFFQGQLHRIMKQTTRNQVPITVQRKLHFVIPPLDEQKRIAEILLTLDNKLALERRDKKGLEKIKRGLMDLLLTGKVRVKVD